MSDALENVNYKTFWNLLAAHPNEALADRGRRNMLAAISLAYQRITIPVLSGMLNVAPGAALDALIAAQSGWVKEGDVVVLPHSAKHQPATPQMNLSTEQKLAILSSTKHR